MAITISSLTPVVQTGLVGSTASYTVSAVDSGGLPLSYEWQKSFDGNFYFSTNLPNNTSSDFTTPTLTLADNQSYWRVIIRNGVANDTIFSNLVTEIGNRILAVVDEVNIVAFVDSAEDNFPDTSILQVGQTHSLTVTATLQNADITTTTGPLSNLNIIWFRSALTADNYPGFNNIDWVPLSSGGNISITESFQSFESTQVAYYKKFDLNIQNISFADSNYLYEFNLTYPNAANSPYNISDNYNLLLVSPTISITKQPGTGGDTIESFCYKSAVSSSDGVIDLSVEAESSAGSLSELFYEWEYTLDGNNWSTVRDLIDSYNCFLAVGSNLNSADLNIERMIYYETLGFRCIISGSREEPSVITNAHYVFMKDVESPVVIDDLSISIVEDRYGPIQNRSSFPEAVQNVIISGDINTNRNTGLNGNLNIIVQKYNASTAIWEDIGNNFIFTQNSTLFTYNSSPTLEQNFSEITYSTPALRRDTDNLSKYRIKVVSTAIFTRSGSVKTLIPYYSDEIVLSVFRGSYITLQPQTAVVYPNSNAAFSITAFPTSGSSISYQWQYNTSSSATGWISIPESSSFTGTQTNLLIYNNVPESPIYTYFRCVISVPNQLATTTSFNARLSILLDYFTNVSSLNDVFVDEGQLVIYTAFAESVSANPVSYQWQFSNNNSSWSNISGATSSTYTINSVSLSDQKYYRCRITSFGGAVTNTNSSLLSVRDLEIVITENIPTSLTFLEHEVSNTFQCNAYSVNSNSVSYQWQILPSGQTIWQDLTFGFDGPSTNRVYTPLGLSRSQNQSKIRCKLTADGIPGEFYTNECIITVNRRFYYFANTNTVAVASGNSLTLDLNPSWTGSDTPSYQWQRNGVDISGATNSEYVVNSPLGGDVYRCRITLANCNQHQYSRNNIVTIASVSSSDFTVTVTISITSAISRPKYYSQEIEKTGAALGTVICIPKPAGYIYNSSATNDDINQWEISISGDVLNSSNSSSVVSSGTNYNSNKPSWAASSYVSPKWSLSQDRFKGFIELRGQWLKKSEFLALYRAIGDFYGSTSDSFRLPQVYGKRLLGTGNVNNNSGSVSIVPEFGQNGLSGGDKNTPGSIGGRYNYGKFAQLPPGSPGSSISTVQDGTAGTENAATFSIARIRTEGFDQITSTVTPSFGGNLTYSVGDISESGVRAPSHSHNGISVGYVDMEVRMNNCSASGVGAYPGCNFSGNSCGNPLFPETTSDFGDIIDGPAGISEADRGAPHRHGLSLNGSATPGNGSANHNITHGDGGGSTNGVGQTVTLDSTGQTIGTTDINMLNSSRALFNNSLRFYLRNNEDLPIQSPYFRLRYMIKAY